MIAGMFPVTQAAELIRLIRLPSDSLSARATTWLSPKLVSSCWYHRLSKAKPKGSITAREASHIYEALKAGCSTPEMNPPNPQAARWASAVIMEF